MGARETALNVLIACRKEAGWSNGVLKDYLSRDRLDRRDAALATRLCYGVVQNRGLLDFYLGQLLTGKLKDLHPAVRDILHMGLYQIYLMDKIPEAAAVNESVDLAKRYCKKVRSAPGLVNGVLRNAVRTKGTLKEPKSWEDKYSHPADLINELKSYVGRERMEKMLQANNAIPPMVVQVNTLRTTAEELTAKLEAEGVMAIPHSWMENALVLSGTGSIEQLQTFRDGLFYVQDPASRLSVLCAELPREAVRILDCCAAPGGKSFAAAMLTEGRAHITSCDVYAHKAELIAKGAERLGICLTALQQDATAFRPEWESAFDAVIVDAPCSGYGIIRKKPDIRYKNIAQMKELPQLQRAILEIQARYVKPGGLLMYSTCTLAYGENEGMVASFLNDHPEFHTEPLPLPAPFPKNESGTFALIPGEYDTDGFFISRLRREL
ncbi:MAG: 16S rRNA (cytosine(967)-C(5))-methyltransferase RsmB [Oscillospiraceae bacterium]|nr:16S rRNA (cytosine(967)-C(5))-methyltransferase RsmB [Oscillospiraceae bacterium]